MAGKKSDIRNISFQELLDWILENKFPKFRAKQVYDWLWKKSVTSYDQMPNVPKAIKDGLKESFDFSFLTLADEQVSEDGTIKAAFNTPVKQTVEGVLIPTSSRMTACISSQAGCSLACKFCATGRLKLLRNLLPGEIYDQVAYLKNQASTRYEINLSNIVYMGMGEPLLNYANVLKSIEHITSPEGLGISPKRITVSTAGIAKMIKKLGDDKVKFNLALSLHAANDAKRTEIMDINDTNNLATLKEALEYFHERTGTRVTFEYIIFKDFNDTIEDAKELAEFAKCVPCKINIIEYNPIDDGEFEQADPKKVDAFAKFLEEKCNLIVHVRRSRGKDIDAACGQLANKNKAGNVVFKN